MQALPTQPQDDGSPVPTRAPLSRRFTYRYIAAVALFALLAVAAKLTVDATGREISELSRQQVQAALQPPRVSQIADLANRVAFQTAESDRTQIDTWAAELRQQAAALARTQAGLLEGDPQLNLPPPTLGPELESLYGSPDHLARMVDGIAAAGAAIADNREPTEAAAKLRADQLKVITGEQEAAGKGLEKAVGIYNDRTLKAVRYQESVTQLLLAASLLTALAVVIFGFRPMARSIDLETTQLEKAERMHREGNERQTFRNELNQALENSRSEAEVLATVGRALARVVPHHAADLLRQDGSSGRLRAVSLDPVGGGSDGGSGEGSGGGSGGGGAGCPVLSAEDCVAIRRGQTMVYESSRLLNVCPKLPAHPQAPCSAVCVPVLFSGRSLGVLHTVAGDGSPPTETEIERLTVLASETGNRLGILATTQATERQAATDGLTGLLNRRSLEAHARALLEEGRPFSVGMADLDRFKELNDTYGHEAGDRALRLFAHVLQQGLRPQDVVSRYGGEEFVVLLPDVGLADGLKAVQRLQVGLRKEGSSAPGHEFTASWGLTDSSAGAGWEDIVGVADIALYDAKRAGRDCIMVDAEAALRAGLLRPGQAARNARSTRPPAVAPHRVRDVPDAS